MADHSCDDNRGIYGECRRCGDAESVRQNLSREPVPSHAARFDALADLLREIEDFALEAVAKACDRSSQNVPGALHNTDAISVMRHAISEAIDGNAAAVRERLSRWRERNRS